MAAGEDNGDGRFYGVDLGGGDRRIPPAPARPRPRLSLRFRSDRDG